jgi:hypothetical protein
MRMTVLTYEAVIATTRVLLTWKVVIRRWQTWTFQKWKSRTRRRVSRVT